MRLRTSSHHAPLTHRRPASRPLSHHRPRWGGCRRGSSTLMPAVNPFLTGMRSRGRTRVAAGRVAVGEQRRARLVREAAGDGRAAAVRRSRAGRRARQCARPCSLGLSTAPADLRQEQVGARRSAHETCHRIGELLRRRWPRAPMHRSCSIKHFCPANKLQQVTRLGNIIMYMGFCVNRLSTGAHSCLGGRSIQGAKHYSKSVCAGSREVKLQVRRRPPKGV